MFEAKKPAKKKEAPAPKVEAPKAEPAPKKSESRAIVSVTPARNRAVVSVDGKSYKVVRHFSKDTGAAYLGVSGGSVLEADWLAGKADLDLK